MLHQENFYWPFRLSWLLVLCLSQIGPIIIIIFNWIIHHLLSVFPSYMSFLPSATPITSISSMKQCLAQTWCLASICQMSNMINCIIQEHIGSCQHSWTKTYLRIEILKGWLMNHRSWRKCSTVKQKPTNGNKTKEWHTYPNRVEGENLEISEKES